MRFIPQKELPMANSDFLRGNKKQHSIKNTISKKMDKDVDIAIQRTVIHLRRKYPHLIFNHRKTLRLSEIVSVISRQYPQYTNILSSVMESSYIRPDGGFLYVTGQDGKPKIILVAEVKHQGTNDKRLKEGLKKQAKGNAIERLGKNLNAVRAIFKAEGVVPFVCFGNGDDFKDTSTIRDRVVTMNDFFPLNTLFVKKEHLPFEPVSMFFRYAEWNTDEITKIMIKVAEEAITHYFG